VVVVVVVVVVVLSTRRRGADSWPATTNTLTLPCSTAVRDADTDTDAGWRLQNAADWWLNDCSVQILMQLECCQLINAAPQIRFHNFWHYIILYVELPRNPLIWLPWKLTNSRVHLCWHLLFCQIQIVTQFRMSNLKQFFTQSNSF